MVGKRKVASAKEGFMARLPGNRFLSRSGPDSKGPGVLTVLLRTYIEDRDRTALDAFFHLILDDHFTDLAIQVHSFGPASTATVHEVVSDSMAKLWEDVLREKYRKAPESAREHLKFLLRRKFIDRRRWWDKDHVPVDGHRETLVDEKSPDPAKLAARAENEQMVDRRLEEALAALSGTDQKIIRLRLEGLQYPEIAEKLGIDKSLMRSYGPRAYQQLLTRLVEKAPTMAQRLKEMKARFRYGEPKEEVWPTLDEIRAALAEMTERVRDAVKRLHVEGVPLEDLERELGKDTLRILLRRGYDLLEARFKVSFPDAFRRAS
jgi:RNA polymerase sigma factor (sigma-70 family)